MNTVLEKNAEETEKAPVIQPASEQKKERKISWGKKIKSFYNNLLSGRFFFKLLDSPIVLIVFSFSIAYLMFRAGREYFFTFFTEALNYPLETASGYAIFGAAFLEVGIFLSCVKGWRKWQKHAETISMIVLVGGFAYNSYIEFMKIENPNVTIIIKLIAGVLMGAVIAVFSPRFLGFIANSVFAKFRRRKVRKVVTEETKKNILIELQSTKKSIREIAKSNGVSHPTVAKIGEDAKIDLKIREEEIKTLRNEQARLRKEQRATDKAKREIERLKKEEMKEKEKQSENNKKTEAKKAKIPIAKALFEIGEKIGIKFKNRENNQAGNKENQAGKDENQ